MNRLNIAIDFPPDNKDGFVLLNIHTMINDEVKETFNLKVIPKKKGFVDLWDQIGEEIAEHMKGNKDYYSFGC